MDMTSFYARVYTPDRYARKPIYIAHLITRDSDLLRPVLRGSRLAANLMDIRNRFNHDDHLTEAIDRALAGYKTTKEGKDSFEAIRDLLEPYANPNNYVNPNPKTIEAQQHAEQVLHAYNWHRITGRLKLDHAVSTYLDKYVAHNKGTQYRAALKGWRKRFAGGDLNNPTDPTAQHTKFWEGLKEHIAKNAEHPDAKRLASNNNAIYDSLVRLAESEGNAEELERRLQAARATNAKSNPTLQASPFSPSSIDKKTNLEWTDLLSHAPGTGPAWDKSMKPKTEILTDRPSPQNPYEYKELRSTYRPRPTATPEQYAREHPYAGIAHDITSDSGLLANAEWNGVRHALHSIYPAASISPELVKSYVDSIRKFVHGNPHLVASRHYLDTASQLTAPEDDVVKANSRTHHLDEPSVGILDLSSAVGPLVKMIAEERGDLKDRNPSATESYPRTPDEIHDVPPQGGEELEKWAAGKLAEGDPLNPYEEIHEPFGSGVHIDPKELTDSFEYTFDMPEFRGGDDTLIKEIEAHPTDFKPGELNKTADELYQQALQPKEELPPIPVGTQKEVAAGVGRKSLPKLSSPEKETKKQRISKAARKIIMSGAVKPKDIKTRPDTFSRVYGKIIREE